MRTCAVLLRPQNRVAYAAFRRLLVLRQVPVGEPLSEAAWARRLGVRPTSFRWALIQLEAEGLLQRGACSDYLVPRLTQRDLWEAAHLRLALEAAAIEEICSDVVGGVKGVAGRLCRLRQACEAAEQYYLAGRDLTLTEADRRFRDRLIDAAGNKLLSTLYHRSVLQMIEGDAAQTAEARDVCERRFGQHRQIVDAMERGAAEQAMQVLRGLYGRRELNAMGQ